MKKLGVLAFLIMILSCMRNPVQPPGHYNSQVIVTDNSQEFSEGFIE